jgi:L-asparaginase
LIGTFFCVDACCLVVVAGQLFLRPPARRFQIRHNLSTKILALHLVPGFDDSAIRACCKDAEALILMLYGTGNAPSTRDDFVATLKEAIDGGTVVVAVSQCPKGEVNLRAYEVGSILYKMGVLSAGDMTIEAASCKLAYLLGYGLKGDALRDAFNSSLRGERTDRGTTGHDGSETLSLSNLISSSPNVNISSSL